MTDLRDTSKEAERLRREAEDARARSERDFREADIKAEMSWCWERLGVLADELAALDADGETPPPEEPKEPSR